MQQSSFMEYGVKLEIVLKLIATNLNIFLSSDT